MLLAARLSFASLLWLAAAHSLAAAEPPPMVFAHYMVCCPRDGHDATVEQYKQEMMLASSKGIDAFALNLGGWYRESYYREITERMFEAANAIAPAFKLFFSFDGTPPADGVVMMRRFGQDPAYLKINGKPLISSYSGSPAWGNELKKQLNAAGMDAVFIPNYQYASDLPLARNYITPTGDFLDQIYRENPVLDGYFFFALDLGYKSPPSIIPLVAAHSRAAGKLSMVGISPFYRGMRSNFRVFEGGGFEGMAAQWAAAIASRPNFVEIVTWNDWGEATYVAPFGGPRDQDLWNYTWGPLLAHTAFLDASRYFIDWFKTGVQPSIEHDRLFYFYRLHRKTALGIRDPDTGQQGRPTGWADLDDHIYFSSFLTAPADIQVKVGQHRSILHLGDGFSSSRAEMDEGRIEVTVTRRDRVVAAKTLEFPITALGQLGNFNYFAGELDLP